MTEEEKSFQRIRCCWNRILEAADCNITFGRLVENVYGVLGTNALFERGVVKFVDETGEIDFTTDRDISKDFENNSQFRVVVSCDIYKIVIWRRTIQVIRDTGKKGGYRCETFGYEGLLDCNPFFWKKRPAFFYKLDGEDF